MIKPDDLKKTFENAVKNPDTVEILFHLIEKSGCFRKGISKDERNEIYLRGYGDFGLYIRELFLDFAPDIYIRFLKEKGAKND